MELGTIGLVMDSPEDAINAPDYESAETGKLSRIAGRILRTFDLESAG
jgi:hypothetical protein